VDQFLASNVVAIIQLLAFLGGGVWLIGTMKTVQQGQNVRLENVEEELSKLRDVVVDLARQEERLNSMDQRLLAQGARVDAQGNRITSLTQRFIGMSEARLSAERIRRGQAEGLEEQD